MTRAPTESALGVAGMTDKGRKASDAKAAKLPAKVGLGLSALAAAVLAAPLGTGPVDPANPQAKAADGVLLAAKSKARSAVLRGPTRKKRVVEERR